MATLLIVYLFALGITLLVFLTLYNAIWKNPGHPDYSIGKTRAQKPFENLRGRLRVLMFGWEFPPFNSGGLGVASLGLAKGLHENDTDVTLVLPKKLPDSAPYARMRSAELPLISLRAINSSLSPYLGSASYAKFTDGSPVYGHDIVDEVHRYGALAGNIAREEAHDVIYAHDWLSFPAGIRAREVSGKPLIAHVHATEFDRTGGGAIDQRIYDIERAGLHAADRIVAVSKRTKDTVVSRYGVDRKKVTVVHNGIDEATAPRHSDAERLTRFKKLGYQIVLFMGRITLQKGPDYFLQAAAIALRTNPRTVFVVAGAGDMEKQTIEEAATLGISDKVFFTGFLRDEEQYQAYAAADLFVMPSVSEPFGITALEAMHVGAPVIISKQSGVAEAVPNAIQVDFWDIEKLAGEMVSLLSDPDRRARLSREGKRDAAALTWKRAAHSIRGVTDEVIAHPGKIRTALPV